MLGNNIHKLTEYFQNFPMNKKCFVLADLYILIIRENAPLKLKFKKNPVLLLDLLILEQPPGLSSGTSSLLHLNLRSLWFHPSFNATHLKVCSLICISSVQTYLFSCPCLFKKFHGYPIDIVNLTCPKLTSWSPESLLLRGFSSWLQQLQPLVSQLRNLGVFVPCLLTASHSPRLVHQQTSLFFLWNISEPTSAATNSVWININHCYLSIGLIQMHLGWSLLPL